ncbi:MAG: hypothetical protein R3Y64_06460, partial [Peptostreptococcaceae bacterium]
MTKYRSIRRNYKQIKNINKKNLLVDDNELKTIIRNEFDELTQIKKKDQVVVNIYNDRGESNLNNNFDSKELENIKLELKNKNVEIESLKSKNIDMDIIKRENESLQRAIKEKDDTISNSNTKINYLDERIKDFQSKLIQKDKDLEFSGSDSKNKIEQIESLKSKMSELQNKLNDKESE